MARARSQRRDSRGGRSGDRLLLAFLLLVALYWVFVRVTPGLANRTFRLGQLASGTWVAFTHGANDAQKTMGVIALALYETGHLSHFYIPTWAIVAAGLAIAAGTYVGGWRIMRPLEGLF
ncbi:MAG TPA: inorganic phosphate transporter [Gaiellaceae bacterium]|nr:inorganic phosphate transporter [Gaiellaceae bacterium]